MHRVPLETAEKVLAPYQEKYFDLNVRTFHEKLRQQEHIDLSHTWVYQALVGGGFGAPAAQASGASAAAGTASRKLRNFAVDQPVWAVAFSPDGKYLATGSKDGAARIWETSTGRELVRLPHTGSVRMVRFTSDGKHVLTTSFDPSGVMTQAREWEWQPDDLIRQVCLRAARSLTPDDWNRYIVIEPYRPVCQVNTQ